MKFDVTFNYLFCKWGGKSDFWVFVSETQKEEVEGGDCMEVKRS